VVDGLFGIVECGVGSTEDGEVFLAVAGAVVLETSAHVPSIVGAENALLPHLIRRWPECRVVFWEDRSKTKNSTDIVEDRELGGEIRNRKLEAVGASVLLVHITVEAKLVFTEVVSESLKWGVVRSQPGLCRLGFVIHKRA